MSEEENVSQVERISRAIEADILNATYPPGGRLDERQLAALHGVSRTPIREALGRLVADGLAEHRARQGVFVSHISLASVFELFEMLAVLESASARLAARRMKPHEVVHLLQAAHDTVEAAKDEDSTVYSAANKRFHEIIYAGSCNRLLEDSAKQLRRRAAPYRAHIHRVAGRRDATAHEHVAIAEAIKAGKGEVAADLMFLHLDIHRPEFADYVFILSRAVEKGIGVS